MPLVVDDSKAEENSRLIAIRLAVLTLRSMETWKQDIDDHHVTMVVLAVIAISAERLTRAELPDQLRTLSRQVPQELLTPCNISSIAAATGLNRETTRRKVNELIEAGLLVRSGKYGIGFAPGLNQREATAAVVRRQLDAVTRFANEMLRDEIIRLD